MRFGKDVTECSSQKLIRPIRKKRAGLNLSPARLLSKLSDAVLVGCHPQRLAFIPCLRNGRSLRMELRGLSGTFERRRGRLAARDRLLHGVEILLPVSRKAALSPPTVEPDL